MTPNSFDLRAFSAENLARCEAENGFRHPIGSWSDAEWMNAILGELGEAASLLKERHRNREGVPGKGMAEQDIIAALADEIADVAIYLDLFAQALGIDLSTAICEKFDRTSRKIGYTPAATEHSANTPNALADIAAERRRQITGEGRNTFNDDRYIKGELAQAAASYALYSTFTTTSMRDWDAVRGDVPDTWPWSRESWKPKSGRRDLVRAGALILAEIERLDRARARDNP